MKSSFLLALAALPWVAGHSVTGPNGKIHAALSTAQGLSYSVSYGNDTLLSNSSMGVVRLDGDFASNLTFANCTGPSIRKESYQLLFGKQKNIANEYSAINCTYLNRNSHPIIVEMVASNTSFAFRYSFPPSANVSTKYITAENTTFRIVTSPTSYQLLQPMDNPIPKYQTFYQPRTNRTKSQIGDATSATGFGLPAFFKTGVGSNEYYIHIKESGFDGKYPISIIANTSVGNNFALAFPDPKDGNGNMGDVRPHSPLPWSTPWRIITIGTTPSAAVEDTAVTDLAHPQAVKDTSFIHPGSTSWSWWSAPLNPLNYTVTQTFIDMAATLSWQWSILDGKWDQQTLGNKTVPLETITAYAKSKGVGLWTWMNSAGDNNNATANSPRDLLSQYNIRQSTLQRFKEAGIVGFKVDGIQSNKQEMVSYLIDILRDTGEAGIMVSFHNCFPPIGWERTYPHFLSVEGLIANEYYSNANTEYASQLPENNVNEAFVRFPIGPSDYSPGTYSKNIYKSNPVPTTDAHETALFVIIDSGMRTFPDTPAAYLQNVDPSIVKMISEVPFAWDVTRFVAGEPGKYFVSAKSSGKTLYIGGINGETTFISPITNTSDPDWKPAQGVPRDLTINLNLSHFGLAPSSSAKVLTVADVPNVKAPAVNTSTGFNGSLTVHMEPFGGFAAKIEFA